MISLLFTILNFVRYFIMYLAVISAGLIALVLLICIIVALFI